MATNFPTSLDTLSNPSGSDKVNNTTPALKHSTQHANANDAIEALEAKVGVNGSAVTTSHDYKLGEVISTDKAVGKTATQTLTNKTLTSPTVNGATVTGTVTDSATTTKTGTLDATGASVSVQDSTFSIKDNSDPTKIAQFDVSSVTTATTRTLTVPNANTTLVGRDTTDTLTNKTIDANGTGNSISNLEVADFAGSAIITAAEGIGSNNNDTTIPTSAAVKTYADALTTSIVKLATGSVTSVSGTASETTIISVSIPAGTLSTGNVVICDFWFNAADGNGTSLTLRAKYGSTTLVTNNEAASSDLTFNGRFILSSAGTTSSQSGMMRIDCEDGTTSIESGTASEDSTGALNLVISVQFDNATNSGLTGGRYLVTKYV